jgi:hypothetical protein
MEMSRVFLHALVPTFSTRIHRFAQVFLLGAIDIKSQRIYLPHRLNREARDFTVRFGARESLTANAARRRTGKLKDFAIQPGRRKSLTVIVTRGWLARLGDERFGAQVAIA